jgi:hypothetical protein
VTAVAGTTAPAQVETEAVVSTSSADAGSAVTEGDFGPGSAAPLADGSAPEGFEVKGNKNSMKFHAPSSPWYSRTNAEVWFRSQEAAEAAGFANAEASDPAETAETTEA